MSNIVDEIDLGEYWKDEDMIKTAYNNINGGFLWHKTPQGSQYWSEVLSNLNNLIEEKE